jgi:hypothetical protein
VDDADRRPSHEIKVILRYARPEYPWVLGRTKEIENGALHFSPVWQEAGFWTDPQSKEAGRGGSVLGLVPHQAAPQLGVSQMRTATPPE